MTGYSANFLYVYDKKKQTNKCLYVIKSFRQKPFWDQTAPVASKIYIEKLYMPRCDEFTKTYLLSVYTFKDIAWDKK